MFPEKIRTCRNAEKDFLKGHSIYCCAIFRNCTFFGDDNPIDRADGIVKKYKKDVARGAGWKK